MAKHKTFIESDEPVSVTVESSGEHWFRLFRSIVGSGVWADLGLAECKVLIVLAERVNDETRRKDGTWIAWPSIETIATWSGLKRRGVIAALASLQSRQLIRRQAGGGRFTTRYELLAPSAKRMLPVHDGAPVHQGARVHRDASQPRTDMHGTGVPGCTQQRLNTEIEIHSITTKLIAAGVDPAAAARLARDHDQEMLLLRIEDLDARRSDPKAKPISNPGAWLVTAVAAGFALHPAVIKRREQAQASAQTRHANRIAELAEREEEARQAALDAEAESVLDAMSEEDRDGLFAQVQAEFGAVLRGAGPGSTRARRLMKARITQMIHPTTKG